MLIPPFDPAAFEATYNPDVDFADDMDAINALLTPHTPLWYAKVAEAEEKRRQAWKAMEQKP